MVWAIATRESADTVAAWRDAFDVDLPILLDDDGAVTGLYAQTMAFPSAAYPQEWLVGSDGVIAYYSNTFEYDELVDRVEAELDR